MIEIRIDHHCGIPVYKQIISAIESAIRLYELKEGDKLPSIRELSAQLNINPNTTAKVYRELELTGLIESKAGSGNYVLPTEEANLSVAEKQSLLKTLFSNFLLEAKKHRISEQEALSFIRNRKEI